MKSITLLLIVSVVGAVAFFVARQISRGTERNTQPARRPIVTKIIEADHGLREILAAVEGRDGEAVEALRGGSVGDLLPELVDYYWALSDWDRKDLIILLVCDYYDPLLEPVYRDALSSASVETRALAVSGLSGDAVLFESFIVDGRAEARRVDAAVEKYRASDTSPSD